MKKIILLIAYVAIGLLMPFLSLAQTIPAPTEKQDQAIEKIAAPLRKKVSDILEADKTGQYQTYKSDLEVLSKETDPKRQQALVNAFESKHKAFISTAFKAAKIDLTELKRQVAGILGHNKFSMDEFGGITSESFLPIGPFPLRFTAELTCPFTIFDDQSSQTLLTNCSGFANDCQISATAITEFDGGCRVKAWTGDKFELPESTFQKITVSAQFDAYAYGFAYALGGYGKAEAKFGVRLQGPGFDQLVLVKDIWCLAPVIWFKRFEFNGNNFQAQAVFTSSFSGGNFFTTQVYNEAYAIAVPALDAGFADCNSKSFDFIKVVATN